MTDIKSSANPLFLRESELRQGVELLYFAYRDFNAEADRALTGMHYGRAHYRVIHFIGRNPGMTVTELLNILAITKQSLSRVLGQLVEDGMVSQERGKQDRRQRLLSLTENGVRLEHQFSAGQRALLANAYRLAGAEAVEGFRKVLEGLTSGEFTAIIEDEFFPK